MTDLLPLDRVHVLVVDLVDFADAVDRFGTAASRAQVMALRRMVTTAAILNGCLMPPRFTLERAVCVFSSANHVWQAWSEVSAVYGNRIASAYSQGDVWIDHAFEIWGPGYQDALSAMDHTRSGELIEV